MQHMQLILNTVWTRLRNEMLSKRAVLLDCKFLNLLKTESKTLKTFKAKRNRSEFKFSQNIEAFVNGQWESTPGKTEWIVDVDKVYAPMSWENKHWVGVCIDLLKGNVTILDSGVDLHNEPTASRLIQPIIDVMHTLVTQLCGNKKIGKRGQYKPPSRFLMKRPLDVPQNERGGDCGPMCLKFIEMHSLGIPLQGWTDEMVNNLRMHYAIDVYEQYVQKIA